MEILSIKAKKKNPNIFIVTTTDSTNELHADIVVKHGIKKGEFAQETFANAIVESNNLIATNLAMKYLNNRIKTEKQIKDYLYKKGYKSNVVNVVIEKLKEYNLINDAIYAQSYINTNPNFSKRKLQQKLATAGIKADCYTDIVNEVEELPQCKKQIEKFFKSKPVDKPNVEKLTRRLISQGFSWDTIKQALNELVSIED